MKIDLAKGQTHQIYRLENKIYGSPRSISPGKSIFLLREIHNLMETDLTRTRSLLQNQESTNENCAYNARSPHLKCTLYPIGSCDGCKDFEQAEDIIPNRIPPELTRSERFDELGQVVGKFNVATMISHTLNEPILNNERGAVEMDLEDLKIEPELMEILNRIDRSIFMQGLEELHEFEKPIEPQHPQNPDRPQQNP
jgi:hypothetical protein